MLGIIKLLLFRATDSDKMILVLYILSAAIVYGEYDGVAFTVGHTSHIDVNDDYTVPFGKVITGHSSQPANGVFTCPEDGLYEFQVYGLTKNNTKLFFELYHNSMLVVSLWAHVLQDYTSAGNAAILYLNQFDTVQVKTRDNYHTVTYGTGNQIYTTFTGVQLGVNANGHQLAAFSAGLVTNQDVAGGMQVFYDKIYLNQGSAYDSYTGTFTGPSGGIYVFHFFSLARQNLELWLELFHNDNYVCSLYGREAGGYADAGNTVILHLRTGDRVQIRAKPNRPNGLYGASDQIYSTFSGYELMQDDALYNSVGGPKAYFSAGLTHSTTVADGQKVVYDLIFIDHWGHTHYDHNHGDFTAPYAGTYLFNFHAIGQKGKPIWLELYHNYRYIDSLYSHVPNGWSSAGNAAIVQMDAGDVVFVQAHHDNALYGLPDDVYCTFSGVLLHSNQASSQGGNGVLAVVGK